MQHVSAKSHLFFLSEARQGSEMIDIINLCSASVCKCFFAFMLVVGRLKHTWKCF